MPEQATSTEDRSNPAAKTRARWRCIGGWGPSPAPTRQVLAEGEAAEPEEQATPKTEPDATHQRHHQRRLAHHHQRYHQELTHEEIPSSNGTAIATTPSTRPSQRSRIAGGQAGDAADVLGALDLGDVADGEEGIPTWSASASPCGGARRSSQRATRARGEGDDAHVLDRRVASEHPFDVAAPV